MSRPALRLMLVVCFVITVLCFKNYYQCWEKQNQLQHDAQLSVLPSEDTVRLRELLGLPPAVEAPRAESVPLTEAEAIMRRLENGRGAFKLSFDSMSELVTSTRTQAMAFTVVSAYLLLLARRLMNPRFQKGIAAERLLQLEADERALAERVRTFDAEVAAKAAPLEAEWRQKLSTLETDRKSLDELRRSQQTAASKLAGDRSSFERDCVQRRDEWTKKDRELTLREERAAIALSTAEQTLAQADLTNKKLLGLVTRLDAYQDLGEAAVHARDTLAEDPDLASAVDKIRST